MAEFGRASFLASHPTVAAHPERLGGSLASQFVPIRNFFTASLAGAEQATA
jgi:hypothetical protein